MKLRGSRLVLVTALYGAMTVPVETVQSEQGAGQKAASRVLPPEVLRMSPVQERTGAREAKQPDPPPIPRSILDGLLLSGKLIPETEPIFLTPRQPYHAPSGSSLSCVYCRFVPAAPAASIEQSLPCKPRIQFNFKNLVSKATYVAEIQMSHTSPSMGAHLDMYDDPGMDHLVQTLPITEAKQSVLFAFNGPTSKTAYFWLVLDAQPKSQNVWVGSVKLIRVKP